MRRLIVLATTARGNRSRPASASGLDAVPDAAHRGGPLGHPKVYLKIGDEGEIVCPYCSRRHILTTGFEHALTTGFGHAAGN